MLMDLLLPALWKLGAVAAGALFGFLGSGFVVRKSTTALVRKEAPRAVVFPFRVVGGVIGGWLVMLGFGGGLGFFGGSEGPGNGPSAGVQQSATVPADAKTVKLPAKPEAAPPAVQSLQIRLLGGRRVVGEKFYQIDQSSQAVTLEQLKKNIDERKQHGLKGIEILIYQNSVARNHPAVHSLEDWAGQQGLSVTIPPTKGDLP
jgi:hypothetical protein